MESSFQRLDVYTEVAPTPEMMNMIIKILVEVLTILAIATKEIKQGRTSTSFTFEYIAVLLNFPELFLKKLAGRTDIEKALKRLDELTNEEARMATAQVLKATRIVDGRIKTIDNKIAEVLDGALIILSQSPKLFIPRALDGKEVKVVLHQVKCSSPPSPDLVHPVSGAHASL